MPVWKASTGEYIVLNKPKFSSSILASGTKFVEPETDIIIVDNTTGNVVITLPHHQKTFGKLAFVKTKVINTGHTVTVNTESGSTIDGAQSKALTANKTYIFVAVDNGWLTILE